MSSTRRQRDAIAPTMFPFLAVLLCTMGALVLILMLVVASAQAAAKQVGKEQQEKSEEIQERVELLRNVLEQQLSEGQIELEKKRLQLQHVENHIQELLDELAELKQTAELLEQEAHSDATEQDDIEIAISELEKQLAEAEAELAQKLEKPDGDKPIFAVIPYDGPNGTHRRPIYLECTADGLLIQPEGIRLPLSDLQPPHGPGNPLDAALRTIRSEFVPANQAVTSTAYPLLIVRPSGIRTYSLARSAMSGWDDQFGYELIDDQLELAFPASTPGLDSKIANAIELARQRQAALVMAMPRKYRRLGSVSPGTHTGGYGQADGYGQSGGYGSDFAGRNATSFGDSSSGYGGGDRPQPGSGRSGFATNGSGALSNSSPGPASGNLLGFGGNMSEQSLRQSADSFLTARAGSSANGSSDTSASGSPTASPTASPNGAIFGPATAAGGNRFAQQGDASGGSNLSSGTSSRSGSSGGTAGGSSAFGAADRSASGNQITMPDFGKRFGADFQPDGSTTSNTETSGRRSSNQRYGTERSGGPSTGAARAAANSRDPNTGGAAGSSSAVPVAAQRGAGWAWARNRTAKTSVVRSIRLNCYEDRWELTGPGDKLEVIDFAGSPQQRAERLAESIHKRVDSWGMAIDGGHWTPILSVQVAPGAEWRYNQLKRLFEHSGLEIRQAAPK